MFDMQDTRWANRHVEILSLRLFSSNDTVAIIAVRQLPPEIADHINFVAESEKHNTMRACRYYLGSRCLIVHCNYSCLLQRGSSVNQFDPEYQYTHINMGGREITSQT